MVTHLSQWQEDRHPIKLLPSATLSELTSDSFEIDDDRNSDSNSSSNKSIVSSSSLSLIYSLDLKPAIRQLMRRAYNYVIREIFDRKRKVTYTEKPLSPQSIQRLTEVGRKTLVLDLDETLVHSCYSDAERHGVGCSSVPVDAVPDYTLAIEMDGLPVLFQVFKRPNVDLFLDFVSKWYDLVIYTASLEAYASRVVDFLDAGRGLFPRRFYRQHCRSMISLLSKDLALVNDDMSKTAIIDNSPHAYASFPYNAIPIKTWIYDPNDEELLILLPFLDALRFTQDMRSILAKRRQT